MKNAIIPPLKNHPLMAQYAHRAYQAQPRFATPGLFMPNRKPDTLGKACPSSDGASTSGLVIQKADALHKLSGANHLAEASVAKQPTGTS